MNSPNHISESLETVFWVKILEFFYVDPGWKKFGSGMENFGSGIREKHPGSAALLDCFSYRPSASPMSNPKYSTGI
jgi:hypothetical protein